jgi:NAD(P)-dependent dehydrogenase (short-subunit alcohol dehydrogenase family)
MGNKIGKLQGKVALITGGGAGIGEAITTMFASEGAAVVVTGRRKELLERVVAGVQAAGGRGLAVPGNVTDEAHTRSAVAQAVRAFGRVNILVNNAAAGAFGMLLHETDDATWDEQLAVNLTGVFRMTRAALPEMLKRGGGAIVNISSIAAVVGLPRSAAYSTTKGGLNAFTRCVAMEYAKEGIRCNAICPGLVETPMAEELTSNPERMTEVLRAYPLGRPGKPEEVAKLVVYLASEDASWVTGSIFTIDGGLTAQ